MVEHMCVCVCAHMCTGEKACVPFVCMRLWCVGVCMHLCVWVMETMLRGSVSTDNDSLVPGSGKWIVGGVTCSLRIWWKQLWRGGEDEFCLGHVDFEICRRGAL